MSIRAYVVAPIHEAQSNALWRGIPARIRCGVKRVARRIQRGGAGAGAGVLVM
jgi:hypothetical protein